MKRILLTLGLYFCLSSFVFGEDLGNLSINPYNPDSISNPYGAGNPYRPDSLTNPYSPYGSPYSSKSWSNPYATDAPSLYDNMGRYRGKLSVNPYDPDSISNPYGRFGNPYSGESIHNPYGAGNPYNLDSPFNPYGSGWKILGGEEPSQITRPTFAPLYLQNFSSPIWGFIEGHRVRREMENQQELDILLQQQTGDASSTHPLLNLPNLLGKISREKQANEKPIPPPPSLPTELYKYDKDGNLVGYDVLDEESGGYIFLPLPDYDREKIKACRETYLPLEAIKSLPLEKRLEAYTNYTEKVKSGQIPCTTIEKEARQRLITEHKRQKALEHFGTSMEGGKPVTLVPLEEDQSPAPNDVSDVPIQRPIKDPGEDGATR